jgi:hypothetical protein
LAKTSGGCQQKPPTLALAVVHGNQVDASDLASMQQETHKSWAAIIAQENSDPDGANILHR